MALDDSRRGCGSGPSSGLGGIPALSTALLAKRFFVTDKAANHVKTQDDFMEMPLDSLG